MRNLRSDNLRHTNDIQKLKEKTAEAQRKFDISEAAEASLKRELKTAEATIRGLKDDLTRTKGLVAQTRTSCANEVRRRDRQIETLKKQVGEAGRARGSRTNPGITTITVTGDIVTPPAAPSDDQILQKEAHDALSKLSRDLNEENEAILKVMNKAMQQLQDMSGWQLAKRESDVSRKSNVEELTCNLDSVMGHMRSILSNPSFVPVEEVTLRDDEITRLKTGWVKMESRWQEAVHLINGWRKRMSTNGAPINEADLQMGLALSPVRVRDAGHSSELLTSVAEEDEEMPDSPCPSDPGHQDVQDFDDDSDSSTDFGDGHEYYEEVVEDEVEEEEAHSDDDDVDEQIEEDVPVERDSSPIPEPPQLSPLKNSTTAGNRGGAIKSKKEAEPTTTATVPAPAAPSGIPMASRSASLRQSRIPTQPATQRAVSRPELPKPAAPASTVVPKRAVTESCMTKPPVPTRARPAPAPKPSQTPIKPVANRRLAAPRDPLPQSSPITMTSIAAKLAASEREADAARVRAKLKAAQSRKPSGGLPQPPPPAAEGDPIKQEEDAENMDPVKKEPVEDEPMPVVARPEKRKREIKSNVRASRRRSTLSPWELETLMTGQAKD